MELEVKNYLIEKPLARERRFRAKAIWNFLKRKYHFETISEEWFVKNGAQIDSVRRYIDNIQKNFPSLRGKDYGDGTALAQAKQIEFGYTPGFYQDIAQKA